MKKYSYIKKSLFTFGISVFAAFFASFTMIYGTSISENVIFKICLQLFGILILAAFLYSVMWTEGERDINRIKLGFTKRDVWRGVKVGCIVMIPYMLTSVLLVMAKFGTLKYGDMLYRILNSHLLIMVNAVLPFLDNTLVAMTGTHIASQLTGIENVALEWWQILVVTAYHLIIPAICGVSYFCGLKEYDITHGLLYKNKKAKAKKRA